eukprot:1750225-Pleurochrysis_carterae.AAC.1
MISAGVLNPGLPWRRNRMSRRGFCDGIISRCLNMASQARRSAFDWPPVACLRTSKEWGVGPVMGCGARLLRASVQVLSGCFVVFCEVGEGEWALVRCTQSGRGGVRAIDSPCEDATRSRVTPALYSHA